MHCIKCNSSRVHSRGFTNAAKTRKKYHCQECKTYFNLPVDVQDVDSSEQETVFEIETKKTTFVITSAQSNTDVNDNFLESLIRYVNYKNAELVVIPINYRNTTALDPDQQELLFDERIVPYLMNRNIRLHPKLKLLAALRINAASESPLSGLDSVTKGDSVIVGHNQLALKTLAVQQDDHPVILTTTGTMSEKNYSISKQGYKADFNHSMSAVVVELDGDIFHLRHLNFDGTGFYDFEDYFSPDGITDTGRINALITGDEHATFVDPKVKFATYTGPGSITNILKPKAIIRHDLLDCYSVSHHHKNNIFTQFAKWQSGYNSLEHELEETVMYVVETSPLDARNYIVASNHNDHLLRWLNECDVKYEPWNAILYHRLMYEMLKETKMGVSSASSPNPFELYAKDAFKEYGIDVTFLKRNESLKIDGIELASHGDRGQNGARGTRRQFANLPAKSIIGHSHSPGIEKGCYQVGTSSYLQLEYNSGASSWMNTHCIIYPNGKRQLVNIINGKWRR